MYCRSCHTDVGSNSTCPSCGRRAGERDLGSATANEASQSGAFPLPPAAPWDNDADEAGSSKSGKRAEKRAKKSGKKREPAAKPRPTVKSEEPTVRLTQPIAPRTQRGATGRGAAGPPASSRESSRSSLGRDEVMTLVAEQPELIESGLRVHSDRKGEAVGVDFTTDVGEIDLLARDSAGGWVLIVIAEEDSEKELVAELLQLMGWVRKHLGKKGQEVRAIVLLDSIPEDLGYAAAAVADSLEFKRYRLALTFEPIEV
jgi:hypothetical protein